MIQLSRKVLYISYTGLLDPLGQSQVLQYVLGLANNHNMHLLTFEKPEALKDAERVNDLIKTCRESGVSWTYLRYHNRPNMIATFYDVIVGTVTGTKLARSSSAEIIHCRSYLAGLMGLLVAYRAGLKHIFDMRGFWPDERVDGGQWSKRSFRYLIFKRLERLLFTHTDHIVSLTHSGARELKKIPYLRGKSLSLSIVPTCTNLDVFRLASREHKNDNFTLGYVGSAGSWYMFEDVARLVRIMFEEVPGSRFLVINQGGHEAIRSHLESNCVDLSRVEIKGVPYQNVSNEIARMDAGVFFIKPVWSKRASCPTRMGEFLGCGLPCLANASVGDVEEDLISSNIGVVITRMNENSLRKALLELICLAKEPGIKDRCRKVAEQKFSLRSGISAYDSLYKTLID